MSETKVCKDCWITFPTRSALTNHIKQTHQIIVKTRFQDETVHNLVRDPNGKFPCLCDIKNFSHPSALQRHAKKCSGQRSLIATTISNKESDNQGCETENESIEPSLSATTQSEFALYS